jgi:pyruvate,orthophosphate dikinase
MPGMMDTILNLGIDDEVERALVAEAGDPAWVTSMRAGLRTALEPLGAPDPPEEQLRAAIGAVLESWQSPRAIAYRAHHGVPDRPGTAVTIQAMVFGNLDEHSGTGVAFSRNPIDGSPGLHGEWLAQGQGEELVSGEVTPVGLEELRASLPDAYEELAEAAARLEREFGDMQDIEFTIQSGRLYLLQSRSGKRSAEATLRIAVGLAEEEVITRQEALGRVTPEIAASIAERAGASAEGRVLGRGEGASPGFARGIVVTDSDDAARLAESGASVILARPTTDPRDVHGMIAAAAVITEIGGATSHAALVTRDLGKPCVVGCGDGAFANLSGETVLVDGGKGEILAGDADLIKVDAATSRAERILAEWDQERVRGERGADDA